MVQEVQTQGNWYQTPNKIEWVWHIERKMSDHTQIREHDTNSVSFVSSWIFIQRWIPGYDWVPTSWTYTTSDDTYYKVDWWTIYVTQWWPYMVEYTPRWWWATNDTYSMNMYADWQQIYTETLTVKDVNKRTFVLNLGRKNKLTFKLIPIDECGVTMGINLKFIKL